MLQVVCKPKVGVELLLDKQMAKPVHTLSHIYRKSERSFEGTIPV